VLSPPGFSVHGFSRQEYWSGLLCPSPGDLPYPGIESMSLMSPGLAGGFFTTSATWEALQSEWPSLKNLQITNTGKGVEIREPSYTVSENENL